MDRKTAAVRCHVWPTALAATWLMAGIPALASGVTRPVQVTGAQPRLDEVPEHLDNALRARMNPIVEQRSRGGGTSSGQAAPRGGSSGGGSTTSGGSSGGSSGTSSGGTATARSGGGSSSGGTATAGAQRRSGDSGDLSVLAATRRTAAQRSGGGAARGRRRSDRHSTWLLGRWRRLLPVGLGRARLRRLLRLLRSVVATAGTAAGIRRAATSTALKAP